MGLPGAMKLTFSPVLLLLPALVQTRNIYLLLKQGNKP